MFNERFREVMTNAREVNKMINVRSVMVYLVQYPIPAPFNVLALLFDLPLIAGRWAHKWRAARGQRSKKLAAAARLRKLADAKPAPGSDDTSSDGTPSSGALSRASRTPEWLDPAMKEQMNTRQYLMERAANRVRPFEYHRSLVFNRGEANAVEKAARERHLQQRKVIEERRRDELLHSNAFMMLQRRLDSLDARLGAGAHAPGLRALSANSPARSRAQRSVAPSPTPPGSWQHACGASVAQSPALIPVPRPVQDRSLLPKRLKLERQPQAQPASLPGRRALPPLRTGAAPLGGPEATMSPLAPHESSTTRYVLRSTLPVPPEEHT